MDSVPNDRFFDTLDYVIFGIMLLLSALIGVYFAFFAKQKQNSTAEYLMGGKKMGVFPISMSLIASYTSGIALLGYATEMYVYGTQFYILCIAEALATIFVTIVYIPVFYKLQITSSYEYLRKRFNTTVRTLGSALFLTKMLLYIPIVIYVPALAFAQVTGFSLEMLIPIICIVCIFYTTLGGIKAVVWTDTLQMMLMVLGALTVAVMGTNEVGGVKNVWDRNQETGRIEFFNMSLDPTIRHTFWNMLIGKFAYHLASCTVNQMMVQRCLAMATLTKANYAIVIFAIGIFALGTLSCYTGIVIYAAFYNCDPVKTRIISKPDQLMPYFVMKITSHVPALPGIFVSGIFSAALSTMSTGLNSMTGVILEDFVRPLRKKDISENKAALYMKIMVVILGIIFVVLSLLVGQLGTIIQASGSLGGITAGTLLGVFTLGILFPWANSTGALIGGFASAILVGWISIGTQLAIRNQQISYSTKPVSIKGCDNYTLSHYDEYLNNTPTTVISDPGEPFPLYTVSYVYYPVIGALTVIVIGLVVSFITGPNKPSHMDPDLFSPVIQKYLKTEYDIVEEIKLMKKRDSIDIWKNADSRKSSGASAASRILLDKILRGGST